MSKIEPQIKIDYIKRYIDGKISQRIIADQLGVSLASVQQWISNYKSLGVDGFFRKRNKHYSADLKLSAVQDYLSGIGSQQAICEKYGIRSKSKLQKWIKKYNSHEELKTSRTGGISIMT